MGRGLQGDHLLVATIFRAARGDWATASNAVRSVLFDSKMVSDKELAKSQEHLEAFIAHMEESMLWKRTREGKV
jgi:hypothetical protein